MELLYWVYNGIILNIIYKIVYCHIWKGRGVTSRIDSATEQGIVSPAV